MRDDLMSDGYITQSDHTGMTVNPLSWWLSGVDTNYDGTIKIN